MRHRPPDNTLQKPITISLNPHQDLYHTGYLLSAVISAGGRILIDPGVDPEVPRIEYEHRTYAVDLRDSSKAYHRATLEACDIYFKRSYVPADAPATAHPKILPFGLNYACRTLPCLAQVVARYGMSLSGANVWKSFLLSPRPQAFESSSSEQRKAKVLFQTRIWPPGEDGAGSEAEEINTFRIRMVQELRRAFGHRFAGGLFPTPEASAFPELITNMPIRRRQYAAWSRHLAIGVYTRGIHGSNGFKLAEYLASSKCIVGHALAHTLPQPLGACHLVRESVDEVVAECDGLLSNPTRLYQRRLASWHYYQTQVRYDRRLAMLLQVAGVLPGCQAWAPSVQPTPD